MKTVFINTVGYLAIFISFLSCKGQVSSETKDENKMSKEQYPKVIDSSLQLQRLYDKTMWMIYCIHCDDTCSLSQKSNLTFGELELRFQQIDIRDDVIEMNFLFYSDTIRCEESNIWGIVYRKGTDSIVSYAVYSDIQYMQVTCDDPNCPMREINPLQPEVVEYIKKNKNKIHPWFRREAIKRGVISE